MTATYGGCGVSAKGESGTGQGWHAAVAHFGRMNTERAAVDDLLGRSRLATRGSSSTRSSTSRSRCVPCTTSRWRRSCSTSAPVGRNIGGTRISKVILDCRKSFYFGAGVVMARTVFTNGWCSDGTGAPPVPGEVVIEGDRVTSTRVGWQDDHGSDQVVDATGCTVMPGMIESHAHLTFPSAVGHIDPSFNPPLDVASSTTSKACRPSWPGPAQCGDPAGRRFHFGILGRLVAADADRGDPARQIKAGAVPGPRMKAASMERDNHPVRTAMSSRSGRGRMRAAPSSASRRRWASTASSSC